MSDQFQLSTMSLTAIIFRRPQQSTWWGCDRDAAGRRSHLVRGCSRHHLARRHCARFVVGAVMPV